MNKSKRQGIAHRLQDSLPARILGAVAASVAAGISLVIGYFFVCVVAAWLMHFIIGWTAAEIVIGVVAVFFGGVGWIFYKLLSGVDNVSTGS